MSTVLSNERKVVDFTTTIDDLVLKGRVEIEDGKAAALSGEYYNSADMQQAIGSWQIFVNPYRESDSPLTPAVIAAIMKTIESVNEDGEDGNED
jgi:hypothetical protein